MNNVKEFMEALKTNPRAMEMAKGFAKPANEDEVIDQYLAIAKELGCALTKEDMLAYLQQAGKMEEVSQEDMDAVNGGFGMLDYDYPEDDEQDPEWLKNTRKTIDDKFDTAGKAIEFTFKSVWDYIFG